MRQEIKSRRLKVAAIIDKLGGTTMVASMLGTSPSSVSNWRNAGRFPAHTYVLMVDALQEMGVRATPAYLWGMTKRKPRA